MSSRTRARGLKSAAGIHTVHIPRQRGRRGAQPFIIVVPEQLSLTRQAAGWAGRMLWRHRGALAPTALALLALAAAGLLHMKAPWAGLVLAALAAGPAVWVLLTQRRRPGTGSVLAWRIGLALLATLALSWFAAAAGFGPLTGPLALLWLLIWGAAQTVWLIVRRTH
ncbi:hypothetical protein QWJ26_22585 [Streptomyces sp. CSDS2]|uniref:hypothetical protein n=1 Tax=Streptomyces sp. CSDS2 TaxID=3055051 RepID=UPI0025B1A172|nr:hypothetical protein [Streptomyces sp. CSDS2]MDN3262538.1 hypothetical protein [Streptomyces sp. CSDS2]